MSKEEKEIKRVLSYKAFSTTEQFEEWQLNNNVTIQNLSPIANNLSGKVSEDVNTSKKINGELKINALYGLMVIYWKEV